MDDPVFGDQTDADEIAEYTSPEWTGSLGGPGETDSGDQAPVDPDSAAGGEVSVDPTPGRDGVLDEMESELADVEHALTRLRDGTYGRCETCGEPIPEHVLAASPASRWCRSHDSVGASPVPT